MLYITTTYYVDKMTNRYNKAYNTLCYRYFYLPIMHYITDTYYVDKITGRYNESYNALYYKC